MMIDGTNDTWRAWFNPHKHVDLFLPRRHPQQQFVANREFRDWLRSRDCHHVVARENSTVMVSFPNKRVAMEFKLVFA